MQREEMIELAELVAQAVVKALNGNNKPIAQKQEKSAYQKTEVLLYNYSGFKKIIQEYKNEILEIRTYGVPKTCGGVNEFVQKGGLPQGLILDEESVESRVASIERSIRSVAEAVDKIDKAMLAISSDPYYKIIPYRYFEGRTQEDISMEIGVSQVTISNNNSRLIRELSMRLFPNQVVGELFL